MRTPIFASLLLAAACGGSNVATDHDGGSPPDGSCGGLHPSSILEHDLPVGPMDIITMWADSTDVLQIGTDIDLELYQPGDFSHFTAPISQQSVEQLGGSDALAVAFVKDDHAPGGMALFSSTDHWASSSSTPQTGELIAVTAGGTRVFAIAGNLMISDDRGATWTMPPIDIIPMTVFANDAQHVFVGGVSADGNQYAIVSSSDGGTTYHQWTQQLQSSGSIRSIWSGDGQTVFATAGDLSGGTLFRSTDGGTTFSKVPIAAQLGQLLSVHGNANGVVTVVGASGAVARSTDGGATFYALPANNAAAAYDLDVVHVDAQGTSWAFAQTTPGHAAVFEIP